MRRFLFDLKSEHECCCWQVQGVSVDITLDGGRDSFTVSSDMSLDVALYDGVLSISDETDTLLYDGVSQVCNLDDCALFLLCTLRIACSLNPFLSLSLKYTCEFTLCTVVSQHFCSWYKPWAACSLPTFPHW